MDGLIIDSLCVVLLTVAIRSRGERYDLQKCVINTSFLVLAPRERIADYKPSSSDNTTRFIGRMHTETCDTRWQLGGFRCASASTWLTCDRYY